VINATGPDLLGVRRIAEKFGKRLSKPVQFVDLFFSTPHRSCVFRDRQSGIVSTFIHCTDVEVRARSRPVS
jgi:hypothetical protein